MRRAAILLAPGIALALNACVVAPPAGPSLMALPGQGKTFEAFQQDDVVCRQYAWQQTGGASPGAAASQSAVGSAVVGTALGAAAGAAIGAASGAAGAGAAIGAGAGLLAGSAIGANNARRGLWRGPAGLRHQLRSVHDSAGQHCAGTANRLRRLSISRLHISLLGVLRTSFVRTINRPRLRRRLGVGRGDGAGGWKWRLGQGWAAGVGAAGAEDGGAEVEVGRRWQLAPLTPTWCSNQDISLPRSAAICALSSSARIGAMNFPSGPIRYSTEL